MTTSETYEVMHDEIAFKPVRTEGRCSVCARVMRVKKDGTIGHHGGEKGKGWMGNREYTCRGVGKPPAPAGGGDEEVGDGTV